MKRWPLLLLLLASVAAADTRRDFAYGIALTTDGDSPFYRVELPGAVYEGSAHSDASDLRVFNADGALVPFAFLPRPMPVRERQTPIVLSIFPLRVEEQGADLNGLALSVSRGPSGTALNITTKDGKPLSGERIIGYVLDASALEEPIAALDLTWAPAPGGLNTRVRVDAGDDLASWRTVIANAPLIDLEYQGRRLKRDRIELPATKAKYLRLSWAADQAPLELVGARFEYAERVVETPRQWREVAGSPIVAHEGDYEFDLAGAFPVDRIAIDLPEINAVVPARLYARASSEQAWRPIASVVLYRLRQGDAEVTGSPTAVSAGSLRYWMLRVDADSGGLGTGRPRMRAGWVPQQLVFAARGSGPFTLAYGNATAASTALPIATLVPGYPTASAPTIGVATVQPGPPMVVGGIERLNKPIDGRRLLLWSTLVLGVAVLAWMAWQLSRQLTPSASDGEGAQPPRQSA